MKIENGLKNKYFLNLIIVIVYVAISVFLVCMIPCEYETTHVADEVKENVEKLEPGESRNFMFQAESSFNKLYLKLSVQSSAHFLVSICDFSGTMMHECECSASDAVFSSETGAKEILIFESSESHPDGTYNLTVTNLDEEDSLSVLTLQLHPEYLSLRSYNRSYLGKIISIVCLLIAFIYLCVVLFAGRLSESPERFFLVSVIFLSLTYFILYLPWDCPDSESHFPAIYRLSNLVLGLDGDEEWKINVNDETVMTEFTHRTVIGIGAYDRTISKIFISENDEYVENDVDQRRMAFYSMLCYLPQVLGLSLCRELGLGGMIGIYVGRLLMNIMYIIGCHRAVNRTPVFKWFFAILSLLPFPLLYASSITYDAMLFVFALLFLANVFRYASEGSNKTLTEICICSFVLGGIKAGAGLILLPFVFIAFAEKKRFKCFLPIVSGILSLVIFDVLLPKSGYFQFGGVDEGYLHTSFAFLHPVKYIVMMVRAYLMNAGELLTTEIFYRQNHFIVGVPASFLELIVFNGKLTLKIITYVVAPPLLAAMFYYMMVRFFFAENFKDIEKLKKVPVFICSILYLYLTPAMLLSFTREGSNYIIGLQGRYYLMVLPVLLLTIRLIIARIPGKVIKKRLPELDEKRRINILKVFAVVSVLSVVFGVINNLTV